MRMPISLGVCVVVAVLAAVAQDPPAAAPKQPDGKKAAEKGVHRTLDVRIRVTVDGEGRLPANSQVKISGQEPKCGDLSTTDAIASIDDKGEALFKGLPICKVWIKIHENLYMPVRKPYNLADYRAPIEIPLEAEH